MSKKIALVTGANRGIGHEVVKQLVEHDFHVYLSGRSKNEVEKEAEKLSAEPLWLDVSDHQSILDAAKHLYENHDHLDVLVNNAGIMNESSLLKAEPSEVGQVIQTNSLGALFLTRALKNLLKAGNQVINVSSGAGAICDGGSSYAPVYSISKTLLNAITQQLAIEFKEYEVAVNAVCPGWVQSDMGGENAPRSLNKGAETISWLANTENPDSGNFYRDKEKITW